MLIEIHSPFKTGQHMKVPFARHLSKKDSYWHFLNLMNHPIGRNGRTFTHMNEPLRRANAPRKRHNNRENGRFWRRRVTKLIVISVVKKMTSLTINIEPIL